MATKHVASAQALRSGKSSKQSRRRQQGEKCLRQAIEMLECRRLLTNVPLTTTYSNPVTYEVNGDAVILEAYKIYRLTATGTGSLDSVLPSYSDWADAEYNEMHWGGIPTVEDESAVQDYGIRLDGVGNLHKWIAVDPSGTSGSDPNHTYVMDVVGTENPLRAYPNNP